MRTFLLLLAYLLLVTPVGLVRRVVKDPLTRRWSRRADTYWISSAPSPVR